jgi:hypothetical protein
VVFGAGVELFETPPPLFTEPLFTVPPTPVNVILGGGFSPSTVPI